MALIVRTDRTAGMDRLFSSLLATSTLAAPAAPRRWTPTTEFLEREDAYLIRADLPGLDAEDVTIEVMDQRLRFFGEREGRGRFEHSLRLPQGIEPDHVTAGFAKGVLEIRIPKPEQRQPRTIEIAAGPAPTALGTGAD